MDVVAANTEEENVVIPKISHRSTSFGDPCLIEKAADMLINAERPAMVLGDVARFSAQYGEAIANW